MSDHIASVLDQEPELEIRLHERENQWRWEIAQAGDEEHILAAGRCGEIGTAAREALKVLRVIERPARAAALLEETWR